MGLINVNGIRLRAYHGCLPEEGVIGGDYVVNVQVDTDFSAAAQTDELNDTVDYCMIYDCVKTEMAIRSKLIEHVAKRIVDALRKNYPAVRSFSVTVIKMAPPINGPVDHVSVTLVG